MVEKWEKTPGSDSLIKCFHYKVLVLKNYINCKFVSVNVGNINNKNVTYKEPCIVVFSFQIFL